MKPCKGWIGVIAMGWLMLGGPTAEAGWNNVFQVCCNSCNSSPVISYSAPVVAAAPACPQPCPTVTYRQRCFYQPVTTYRMQVSYQPVTTYRRSYYYESVTSFRYSTYYDPCTCRCRRVAKPVVSLRLRSRCDPVVSYVQRCNMVPVTTMRQSFYLEPVVTYANPCDTAVPSVAVPGISEGATPSPVPSIQESPNGGGGNSGLLAPQGVPVPGGTGTQRNRPATPEPPRATNPGTRSQTFSPDRIASTGNGRMRGTLVRNDRITPMGNTKVIFVHTGQQQVRQEVVTDPAGRFDIQLPAGRWFMYIGRGNGKALYHSRQEIQAATDRPVQVVSRGL